MRLHSILLVEDDEAVRFALIRMLGRHTDDLVATDNGTDALSKLTERRFGALVCDLRLPGMAGEQVCAEARANHPRLPIVAVSGFAAQEARMIRDTGWVKELAIRPGDHVIGIVTEGVDADLLPPYLDAAFHAGEPCVTVACPAQVEDARRSFRHAGLEERLARIAFHDPRDLGTVRGRFDPERFIEETGNALNALLAAGASCIWHSGLMRWLSDVDASAEDIIYLEASLNNAVEGGPISGFCIYDARYIGTELLVNLLRTHPKVLLDDRVVENPCYERPDEILRQLGR